MASIRFESILALGPSVYVFIVFLAVAIAARLLYNKYGHGINDIPGPTVAGLTDLWRLFLVWGRRPELTHQALHKKHGSLVRLGPNTISVSDPAAIKIIYGFRTGFIKSDFYTLFRAVARGRVLQSLVNITDETFHGKIRRHVSNAFSMSTLVQFEPLVDSTSTVFLEQLSRFADQEGDAGICDLGLWLQFYAFDVIGELTFSKRLGFVDNGSDVEDIIKNIEKVASYVAVVGQIPKLDKLLLKSPIRLWFSKMGLLNENSPVVNFARARMAAHEEKQGYEGESPSDTNRLNFLSRFREAQEKDPNLMTDERVLALTVGNVLGGSDTTAITLRALFYFLLRSPSKLQKLTAELDQKLGSGDFNGLPKLIPKP